MSYFYYKSKRKGRRTKISSPFNSKGKTMRRKGGFIPQWFKKRKSAVSSAILVILIYAIPRFASGKIMIDETMPGTIPPPIVADWKAKDSASFLSQIKGENFYSWMIENIYSDLPETYTGKITHGTKTW